jgi:hypothetical protein
LFFRKRKKRKTKMSTLETEFSSVQALSPEMVMQLQNQLAELQASAASSQAKIDEQNALLAAQASQLAEAQKLAMDAQAKVAAQEEQAKVAALEEQAKVAALEEQAKVAALEEQAKVAALEEQAKVAALEEQAKVAALEEHAKVAALEEQAKVAALEEQAKVAALEEQAKVAALEEQAKVAALEEHAKVAALEEHAKNAALEEQAKVAALEEQAKVAALEEHAKVAALEEQAKVAALEEHAKVAALEEHAKVAALEEHAKVAALEEQAKVAALEEHAKVAALADLSSTSTVSDSITVNATVPIVIASPPPVAPSSASSLPSLLVFTPSTSIPPTQILNNNENIRKANQEASNAATVAAEKAAAEKAKQAVLRKAAADKIVADKLEKKKIAEEKAAADKLAKEEIFAAKVAAQKEALAKAAADREAAKQKIKVITRAVPPSEPVKPQTLNAIQKAIQLRKELTQNPDAFKNVNKNGAKENVKLKTYKKLLHSAVNPQILGRSWFKVSELASIYGFPSPTTNNVVIGVISFGGGLYGSVDANGVLTNGDVQSYWNYLGIQAGDMPTVVIKAINGATNNPGATDGSTDENTLDVETIGGCCPTSKLTIILYIAPNSLSSFASVFNYALNTPVTVNGTPVLPSILSVSWGAPEAYYSNLSAIDSLFNTAVSRGINICVATGDNGSSDGLRGNNVDFPSSSPNVIAVGGTSLVSTTTTYSADTTETAWSSGGGGVSAYFSKPSYQSGLSGTRRCTPDIASDADPNTGVVFYVNGNYVVYGGTSVSAPTFAGFLACINAQTFANPRMYAANSNCFRDIRIGSNGAYSAKVGYDDCTGLGSINAPNLKVVLLATVNVSSVSISVNTLSVNTGNTVQALAIVSPANASNKTLTWTTSNASVATVNINGLILGVGNGSAQIRATTVDGGFAANVTVLVTTLVTRVTLDTTTLTASLARSQTHQFVATVLPTTATTKTVQWTSSNTNIATITSTGFLTAKRAGRTTVQVKTTQGGYTAVCAVTVTA